MIHKIVPIICKRTYKSKSENPENLSMRKTDGKKFEDCLSTVKKTRIHEKRKKNNNF